MSEPTLNLARSDLYVLVALERGFDPNPANWSSNQQQIVDLIVARGLRQFYYPAPLEDNGPSYDWSFIKPVASISLPASTSVLQLPDDFGGLESQISITQAVGSGTYPWLLKPTHEEYIRQFFVLSPGQTGPPSMAAVAPIKGTTQNASTRWNLIIAPISDQAYTLQVPYYVNPDYVSNVAPYAYGGSQHAETIQEACLKASENFDGESGVHTQEFYRRLAASISMDRRLKPQKLRRNLDRSDDGVMDAWPYPYMHGFGPHTYVPPPPGF